MSDITLTVSLTSPESCSPPLCGGVVLDAASFSRPFFVWLS